MRVRSQRQQSTPLSYNYGAYRSRRREANVKEAKRILARLEMLPLKEDSAEEAGRIFANLEAKGVSLDFRDVLTAGVSLTNHLKLVTRNTDHYSRITDLEIESNDPCFEL